MGRRYVLAMKTGSKPLSLIGPVALLAVFAAGGLAGPAFASPLPPSALGLLLVLLALRVGVMAAAVRGPLGAPARPSEPEAGASRPALRAANG